MRTLKQTIPLIRRRLLTWYGAHARDLPWRRTTDPYAIWVSEVMLQQTQVRTVIPYYERFMQRFPDIETLARARMGTVLKMWEGLGYYTRGRNLHTAARQVVKEFNGRLPDSARSLQELPGIGRYTANAIASIAFDEDVPVVDGNVMRVLCRVFRIKDNPTTSTGQKKLWDLALSLLPKGRAGTFNQALMELGACLCTVTQPHCPECPLRRVCLGRRHQEQELLPVKKPSRQIPIQALAVALIWKDSKLLITQRNQSALLHGLWEFPAYETKNGKSPQRQLPQVILKDLGLEILPQRCLFKVKHAYSHFRIEMSVYQCRYGGGSLPDSSVKHAKWSTLKGLERYPLSRVNRKIIARLRELTQSKNENT
ncbi:MAG: A/G-specific adenine glycosylase [Sedimentisphaerales bacterium]|nr:A/G-specific adenine glycosylase [Sedimentisphaerales bacterium]